jgi:hypothetical protein
MVDEGLAAAIVSKRQLWRSTRERRLARKRELLSGGMDIGRVRRDREYRALKKQQRALTVSLRHLEKKQTRQACRDKKS